MKKLNNPGCVPAAVYRLQLNSDFTFIDAIKILPYLKALGVEGIYCSPYFKAFSEHGYDVTDPNTINPKIGTFDEYLQFCEELKKLGLMHIVDIVPNHMGIKGGENIWWQDVLENGPYSEFASFFDINWSPEKKELQDRALLPILGSPYGKALENQEIKLAYAEGKFHLQYADYPLPVSPHSYAIILENELDLLKLAYDEQDPEWKEYQQLIELYRFFPVVLNERAVKKQEGIGRLSALFNDSVRIRKHINRQIVVFNGKKHRSASFDLMDKLLEMQFYRLSYWRVASHEINYRRFFNIPEFISLKIEEDKVLEMHHRLLFELIEAGHIQGLRIDHPDGLYDPRRYFERLREKCLIYTVVEKILDRKELLPENWEIEGTVGYEYLNFLNGIFIQQSNEKAITEIYEENVGQIVDFDELVYQSKKLFSEYEMVSEVESIALRLDRLSESNRQYRDFTRHDLTKALAEVIACFPVYRTYIAPEGLANKHESHYIKIAIAKAKNRSSQLDASIFDFLEKVLLGKIKAKPEEENAYRTFAIQFQQLTAPMMAKGLEDTAFYVYNRFISLNEVGGDPPHFGCSLGEFHKHNQLMREKWPYRFLTTSTHDTKRSEDVRMRLNVLSEMPEKWKLEVRKWMLINSKHRSPRISFDTEYFIYQTLLGVWPHNPIRKEDYPSFCERIWQVVLKSIKEAKQDTSWHHPDLDFEEGVRNFLFSILSKEESGHFLKLFHHFHKEIDRYGGWNSLSQVAIKIGSPGVVDIYQGNELLHYRLVDPDNRGPVDFELRKKALAKLRGCLQSHNGLDSCFSGQKNLEYSPLALCKHPLTDASLEELFLHDLSKTKLYLQTKALHYRLANKDLFLEGSYIPLVVQGERKNNVIAFMRKLEEKAVIVLAGRFFSEFVDAKTQLPLGKQAWGDTSILLPTDWKKSHAHQLFTGQTIKVHQSDEGFFLLLAEVFKTLPVSYVEA